MYCICSNDEMKVKDYSVDVLFISETYMSLFILIKVFIGHDYFFSY